MPGVLTSSVGVISLLDEPQPELQVYALQTLDELVDQFWAEIANSVSKIEILYEDEGFSHRELAALVASKVYYHLGELNESLTFALGAGKLLDLDRQNEFTETIIAKCIDEYVSRRSDGGKIDSKLESIVESMFQRCFDAKEYKQAIGIALESRRLDVLEKAITIECKASLMEYVLDVCMTLVQNLEFRNQILHLLVRLFGSLEKPDYISVGQCYVHLDDAKSCADMLQLLLDKNMEIEAYQVAFDLEDNAKQDFLHRVIKHLGLDVEESTSTSAMQEDGKPGESAATKAEGSRSDTTAQSTTNESKPAASSTTSEATSGIGDDVKKSTTDGAEQMNVDEAESKEQPDKKDASAGQPSEKPQTKSLRDATPSQKIKTILSGDLSIQLHLEFLQRNNHSDMLILKNVKNHVDARNSIHHSALTFANAFMYAGTKSVEFLHDSLDWLFRVTNWSKFSTTAALGVIHKGNLSQSLTVLGPYLPKNGVSNTPYSEGGALFALGLIHANHGSGVLNYLRDALKNVETTQNDVIQHGACLGIGVAGMATADENMYEELKMVLHTDSAIAGEAAGIGMGLVMLGSASQVALADMLQYAHETQHEKIIRGLAVGMSLIMYGREEEADTLIEQLTLDKDPILRYGGIFTVAMAYAGTGNNKAIKRLLHFAVSDVNDDVRRASVMSLGFLLFSTPERVPRTVELLAESYNPHVRYGATLALGIACGGTGMQEALDLLEPMAKDPVDYVRQGTLIAMAMILVQQNEVTSPKVVSVRRQYERVLQDKHEDHMARFGAILATGILDAGGRNVTLSLRTSSGHPKMSAIVGMALFTQHWYWYPLTHLLCLAFTPTALIGLNKNLEAPQFEFVSHARPSLFAYPPPTKPPTSIVVEKVATAVLSTTAKVRARAKKSEKEKGGPEQMEVDDAKKPADDKKDETKKKTHKEAQSETLQNMSRVLPAQIKHVMFPDSCRYVPVKRQTSGILMLHDRRPEEEEKIIDFNGPKNNNTTLSTSGGNQSGRNSREDQADEFALALE